jgi:hypothetical protein
LQLDIPGAWTALLEHAQTNGWEFVTAFQATEAEGGSFNSVIGPNSIAAIKAFYA